MSPVKPIAASQARDAAVLFAALGDPTRIRLLDRLSTNGRESTTQLCERADVTRQAITKHLTVLADAGLVRDERRGRERLWSLEPKRLEDARRHLDRVSEQWDEALGRLTRHLEGSLDAES